MNGEDPTERPELIRNIINGLERYNPEAAGTLESYLQQQCEEKFCDCNANRALLKLSVLLNLEPRGYN
jgi:translation initiation factor 3 subunit K